MERREDDLKATAESIAAGGGGSENRRGSMGASKCEPLAGEYERMGKKRGIFNYH